MTDELWKGEFGDEYNKRNESDIENNAAMFDRIFWRIPASIQHGSILEFGCGTGKNLRAIHSLFPKIKLFGVEINKNAVDSAERLSFSMIRGSIFDFKKFFAPIDLVLTKGLLIHIEPEKLPAAYDILYKSTNNYILICEYYSKQPTEIEYRGQMGQLWKRDFCGEIMDKYPDLKLKDYGFVYDRDKFPQDSLNWFLLAKE